LSVIDQHALSEILGSAGTDKVIYDLSTLVGIRQRIRLPGNGARGVVMKGHTAWVAQFFSDNICKVKIDPAGIPEITSFPLGPDQELTEQRRGNLVFNSAQYCFQQWQSCASCHPGDARVDGLNWDLLNDGAGNPKNTRSLLYAHRTPPVMSLGVRSTAEMAVRAGMHHIQFVELPEEEAMAIDAYLKSLKPVPSPFLADGKRNRSARKGEKVFQKANCATCHSGSMYTDQKSYDVDTGTGKDSGKAFDTPALNELWRTGPYLHDGRAVTLYEVLGKYNRNDRHGKTTNLTSQEMDDLVAYLLTL
jgi:cytochrome c peroxidase